MVFVEQYGLLGLFLLCFFAATIIPLSSEFVLTAMLLSKTQDPWIIFLVASFGNILGGWVNYFMGYFGGKVLFKKHLKIVEKYKFTIWIRKYGSVSALLGWLPLLGDSLLIALGFYRINFWYYSLFMILGKCLRYAFIVWIVSF